MNIEDEERIPESPLQKKHITQTPSKEFPKTPQKRLLKSPDEKTFASQQRSRSQTNRQSVQAIFQQPARQIETPKSSKLESTYQQSSSSSAGQTKSSSRFYKSIDNRPESLYQHKALNEIRSPNIKQTLQTRLQTPRIIKTPVAKSPPEELQVVVRKFPGPAGLLPDELELSDSTSTVNYLHILDANEQNNTKSMNESRVKDLCTQATKNLFSDGSWRVMMDDLPPNFLDNQDIMSMKMSGVDKIPLLAAVIHRYDHAINPKVLLKDMSDTIEGIMHREVPIKFPNILQPGVVIILGNVSCLAFKQKSWRTRKIIMITPNNVLGIYGEKTRFDSTPTLDAIISGELSQTDILERFFTDNNSKENKPVQNNNFNNKKLKEISKEPNKNDTDDYCDIDFDLDDFDNAFDDSEVSSSIEKINLPEKMLTAVVIDSSPSTSSSLSSGLTQKSVVETQSSEASQVWNKKTDTSPEIRDTSLDTYTGFGADLLLESDSDDELMSQVDIDAEAYNSKF